MVLASILLNVTAAVFEEPALASPPEGRVYEQVSPEFKGGYSTGEIQAVAQDGDSIFFESLGMFNGVGTDRALNPYLARRTANGWVTSSLLSAPVAGEFSFELSLSAGQSEISPDLSRFTYLDKPGATYASANESPTATLQVLNSDGTVVQISPEMTTTHIEPYTLVPAVVGGSLDLSVNILSQEFDEPSHHIVPVGCGQSPADDKHEGGELFEAEACSVRLVGLDNQGKQLTRWCAAELGGGPAKSGAFGAVSEPRASEVFFSTVVNEPSEKQQCETSGYPVQVFVRLDGEQTLEVSKPLAEACAEVPCPEASKRAPAVFQGASEDGSRVFFTARLSTASQSLVPGDNDVGNNLYMATIGCTDGNLGEACASMSRNVTSLVEVSHDPNTGQSAEVEPHMVAISADGSHVYFVARGVLAANANHDGEAPQQGAENLYVYEPDTERPGQSKVAFVADLCSGPELSGTVTDGRCPASLTSIANDQQLWSDGAREAQTTHNGDFLVFSTYASLIQAGSEADSDTARDVYRYDAQTGGLRRITLGEGGMDGNGNNSAFDTAITPIVFGGKIQEQYELTTRAISEAGSTIVFSTNEPLSVAGTNGQQDVYVWHEGLVGLISSGAARDADAGQVITPSGGDILFTTSAELVPGDTDGLRDVYDARVGGGFPNPPAAPEECSADACQGPLTSPTPLFVPGSELQSAGRSLPPRVVKRNGKHLVIKHNNKIHKKKRKLKHRERTSSTHKSKSGRHGR